MMLVDYDAKRKECGGNQRWLGQELGGKKVTDIKKEDGKIRWSGISKEKNRSETITKDDDMDHMRSGKIRS